MTDFSHVQPRRPAHHGHRRQYRHRPGDCGRRRARPAARSSASAARRWTRRRRSWQRRRQLSSPSPAISAITPRRPRCWSASGTVRAARRAGQQCRHHPPRRRGRLLRSRLGRRHGRQSEVAVLSLPGLWTAGDRWPRREGRIVNIASVLSFQGGIRVASYTASKHGVVGLTRLLANEWAAKGINVNAIAPGYVETNNTEALRDDPDRSAAILGRIPAGRWGEPDDIGDAAVFLLAPASALHARRGRPGRRRLAGPVGPLCCDGDSCGWMFHSPDFLH